MIKAIIIFLLKWFTIPAFMSFNSGETYSYRITGYYYRYYFADGGSTDPYPCKRIDANCIGGYGVCGSYIPFEEVRSVSIKLNKARLHFFKQYINKSEKKYIKEYQRKVDMLKSLPKGLDKETFEELIVKIAVNRTMTTLKKRNYVYRRRISK